MVSFDCHLLVTMQRGDLNIVLRVHCVASTARPCETFARAVLIVALLFDCTFSNIGVWGVGQTGNALQELYECVREMARRRSRSLGLLEKNNDFVFVVSSCISSMSNVG